MKVKLANALVWACATFAVVNLLGAALIGYTVAAGAGDVYHGVTLGRLAWYMATVGFLGIAAALMAALLADIAKGDW